MTILSMILSVISGIKKVMSNCLGFLKTFIYVISRVSNISIRMLMGVHT